MHWLVDGNNVMGSRPDGWWNDRAGAAGRLADEVAEWCATHDDPVVLYFDGADVPEVSARSGGNLAIRYAPGTGAGRRRDAADDEIVAEAVALDAGGDVRIVVVTADRGLRFRLGVPVDIVGPRVFLDLIGAPQK